MSRGFVPIANVDDFNFYITSYLSAARRHVVLYEDAKLLGISVQALWNSMGPHLRLSIDFRSFDEMSNRIRREVQSLRNRLGSFIRRYVPHFPRDVPTANIWNKYNEILFYNENALKMGIDPVVFYRDYR